MLAQMSCEKIQKIFEKKEIRVDFLGASATEGEGLKESSEAYPFLWTEKIEKQFPSKRFMTRNLAQSGNFASHGLFVAEKLVKEHETDIVFLEYALNDETTPFSVDIYESLVRKLLGYSATVVIPIVLPIRNMEKEYDYMIEIARQYQLPWLDIGTALRQEMDKGVMQWEDYAQDDTHPNRQGHVWIAEKIMELFQAMLCFSTKKEVDWSVTEACYFKNTYEHLQVKMLEETLSFPMEFTVECSNFWILYRKHYDDRCGTLQVFLDQNILIHLHGYSMFCWDYYFPEKIWQGSKREKHTFRLKMLPQDENKEFRIKAVGWC